MSGGSPDGACAPSCKALHLVITAAALIATRPVTLRLFLREELTDIEYFMAPHGRSSRALRATEGDISTAAAFSLLNPGSSQFLHPSVNAHHEQMA